MSPLDLKCSRTPCKPHLRLLSAALPAPTSICSPRQHSNPHLSPHFLPSLAQAPHSSTASLPSSLGCPFCAPPGPGPNHCPSAGWLTPSGIRKHHHKPVSFICVLLPRTGLQKHIRLSPSCHHLSGFPGVRGRQRRLAEAELNTYQTTRSRWSAVTWPGGTRDLPFLWDL